MDYTSQEKLELFEKAILEKAGAQSRQIIEETEKRRQEELDREKNRLLDEVYRQIQGEIAQMKEEAVVAAAQEKQRLKQELYRQREQYLTEMLSRVRVELIGFTQGSEYPAYLVKKAAELAKSCPNQGDIALRLRREDLQYAEKIKEAYGDCRIQADDTIAIGGIRLEDRAHGAIQDETLDAALQSQRDWFYRNSNFYLE